MSVAFPLPMASLYRFRRFRHMGPMSESCRPSCLGQSLFDPYHIDLPSTYPELPSGFTVSTPPAHRNPSQPGRDKNELTLGLSGDVSSLAEPKPSGPSGPLFRLHLHHRHRQVAQDSEQFLVQPKDPSRDFAYVTILWSDDFVDNAIVWATGLRAVGSTFRRICMIGRNRIARSRIQILARRFEWRGR